MSGALSFDEGTDIGLDEATNVSIGYKEGDNAFTGKISRSRTYVLHFPPGTLPDVKSFWSVTMYGAASGTFNLW